MKPHPAPVSGGAHLNADGLDCVLVGLPVTEVCNPLIIPLAGHELGHALWGQWRSLYEEHQGDLQTAEKLGAMKVRTAEDGHALSEAKKRISGYQKAPYHQLRELTETALKKICQRPRLIDEMLNHIVNQVEEVFCDFIGIALFGESYVRAFQYLVSPNISEKYRRNYPSVGRRFNLMAFALTEMCGESIPAIHTDGDLWWIDAVPESTLDRNILHYGERALEDLKKKLAKTAKNYCHNMGLEFPTQKAAKTAKAHIAKVAPVPAKVSETLPKLILAGWMARDDDALFGTDASVKERREAVVGELILKSIELLEIQALMARREREESVPC